MKITTIFFVLLQLLAVTLTAQVGITADGSEPDPSAMLDVKSTSKGFLPPRMTSLEMNDILMPSAGLLVYNTTVKALYWYDGSTWQRVNEFNYVENDPVFNDHPASSVSTNNIDNWDQAYAHRLISASATQPLSLNLENNHLTGSIPKSGTIQSGYLSATDWNIFNSKQDALYFGDVTSTDLTITGGNNAVYGNGLNLTIKKGNLTETGSSVLTITNGANAVLGTNGAAIQVNQAGPSQSGYLNSHDWNLFNQKVSSQWTQDGANLHYLSGSIGVGTSSPSGSSVAEFSSTTKGLLLPRMDRSARNGIVAPSEGLMVYCLNCGTQGALSIYTNGSWLTFSPCMILPPSSGTPIMSQNQVTWNWSAVPGASGYKWNSAADYETAMEMGTALFKTETGTVCDTTYIRYVWAYSSCGESPMTAMTATLPVGPPPIPTSGMHTSTQNSITWAWQAVPGAKGYKWNTVNDMATATDKGSDTTHTEIGDTCGMGYQRYVWAYNGCGFSEPVTLTQSTLPCWACGITTLTINHSAGGGVAPVNKTTLYATVTNIPGEPAKCWITQNLGASQQAAAVNDASEASAGWHWQFNLRHGYKHNGTTLTPSWTISGINENSDWQASNDPCTLELGTYWRIPSYSEWYNVDNTGGWSDWSGPWNSGLKLHAAGYLYMTDGSLNDRGVRGYYWSTTQISTSSSYGFRFFDAGSGMGSYGKAYGFTVRCVRELET